MSNGTAEGQVGQQSEGGSVEKGTEPHLVSIPVLLRALASYLEVTGEAEKFTRHLVAAMQGSGQEVEIFQTDTQSEPLDSGGRPDQI